MQNPVKPSVNKNHKTELFNALDAVINEGLLDQLSTQQLAQQSGVMEAEILRLFTSLESIYEAWAKQCLERLQRLLSKIPTEKADLLDWVNQLAQDDGLRGLLCMADNGHPALDNILIEAQNATEAALLKHIIRLSPANTASPQNLLNSLLGTLRQRRADDPPLEFLPWESELSPEALLPSNAILKRLAISESGFVFDPSSGQSFTVNETGLAVLRLTQQESDIEMLLDRLAGQFDADAMEIKRDVQDFAARLKSFLK